MSRNFTPDDLFKKQLSEMPFEPSDASWQKIEAALQADKDAKKDKRRWAIILLLVLVTGGAAWFALQYNGSNSDKTTAGSEPTAPGAATEKSTAAPALNPSEKIPAAGQAEPEAGTGNINPSKTEAENLTGSLQKTKNADQTSITNAKDQRPATVTINGQAGFKTRKTGTQKTKQNKAPSGNNPVLTTTTMGAPVTDNKAQTTGIALKKTEAGFSDLSVAEPLPEPKKITASNTEPAQVAPPLAAAANTPKNKQATSFLINGGAAIASPFNKTGYYGGVLMAHTTKDNKHLYAGISLVSHKLEHQYISADKLNSPSLPVTTDAVVDGMTSLRLSAGYLFPLNGKGQSPNSFIMAGFEPSYAIRLRTLYYETPGQPAIINSPIMEKAVNRFNLFFTAGWMKTFKPGIGVSLKAGYGLIPITDRAFYNRTLKNNNIKSLEVGLQYRISKK